MVWRPCGKHLQESLCTHIHSWPAGMQSKHHGTPKKWIELRNCWVYEIVNIFVPCGYMGVQLRIQAKKNDVLFFFQLPRLWDWCLDSIKSAWGRITLLLIALQHPVLQNNSFCTWSSWACRHLWNAHLGKKQQQQLSWTYTIMWELFVNVLIDITK